jgi:hypothetical protein
MHVRSNILNKAKLKISELKNNKGDLQGSIVAQVYF